MQINKQSFSKLLTIFITKKKKLSLPEGAKCPPLKKNKRILNF